MIPPQTDLKGDWPKRLWCRHKDSVTRKLYWTCFDCHAIRWNHEAIDTYNRELEFLEIPHR